MLEALEAFDQTNKASDIASDIPFCKYANTPIVNTFLVGSASSRNQEDSILPMMHNRLD
jgi:hypothetical protein